MAETFSLDDAYGKPAGKSSPPSFTLDDAYAKPSADSTAAAASLKSISLKEFEGNNLFMQLGASLYKHLTGQTTEGSGAAPTPEMKQMMENPGPELKAYMDKTGMQGDVPWYRMPTALLERFHESPQTTLVELGKGVLYDPELLYAGALRAPSLVARVVKGAAVGGGISAAQSLAQQSVQKDEVSLEEAGKQGLAGAGAGALLSAFSGRGGKPEEIPSVKTAAGEMPMDEVPGVPPESVNTEPTGNMDTVRPPQITTPPPLPHDLIDRPMGGAYENVDGMDTARETPPPPVPPIDPITNFQKSARLAAMGVGAVAGMYLDQDNKIEGAILGALAGVGLTKATPENIKSVFSKLNEKASPVNMNAIGDLHEETILRTGITINKLQNDVLRLVPTAERQAAITHWMDGDKSIPLTTEELEAANILKQGFSSLGQAGVDSKVLSNTIDDYITHLWKFGKQDEGVIEAALKKKMAASMSPNSPFGKQRFIETIAEGKALGLTPLTENAAEIFGIYGNSLARSIANKQMLESLKTTVVGLPDRIGDGTTPMRLSKGEMVPKIQSVNHLIEPAASAPDNYVTMQHPQLQGLKVHPDIEPSMKFFFDSRNPGVVMQAIEGINTAAKRMVVSASLFHAKALTDAFIAGGDKPLSALGKIRDFSTGKDEYLQQLNKEGVTPLIDKAIKGGLTFSLEKGTPAVEDVGGSFYKGMDNLKGYLNQTIPGLGKPVEGLIKINHAVDTLTWARLHTGMKLNIFTEKMNSLIENNARAHERNPSHPLMTEDQAGKLAASFTNDLFGGINWRRASEAVQNRWGRQIALGLAAPSSRRGLQLLMFAPDWTVSTTRAMLGAFGKGSGVRGLMEAKTLPDLHRQYIMRAAAYYALVGTALNQAFTGHNLWDNKDPTRIDLGGGKTMQWSKHTMEPVHWILQPGQQALNKLGVFPRQMAEQALGAEYLSAKGRMPPMKGSRLHHMLKAVTPIGLQANDPVAAAAGFVGMPIYGQSPAEKQIAASKARIEKLRGGK